MVVISIKLSDGSVIRGRTENGSSSVNGSSVHPVKWKPRKVSAVRDFPPGCGPIVHPINVVPLEAEPLSSPVTDNHVDEGVELIVENLLNSELKNGNVEVDNDGSVIKKALPKMKFARRKVSAIRDFPPFCGLDADEPTEEDRIRINGKRSFGTESNGGGKDELVHKTQSNESSDPMKSESHKKVQNIGQACQELVVYTRDRVLKKVSPVDDASDEDSKDDSRDKKSLTVIQKDVMDVKNREVVSKKRVTKRPLDDDTKKRVYNGDKIMVVVGLKAPSLCSPGTQQKDLTNKANAYASKPQKTPVKNDQKNMEMVVVESTSTGKPKKIQKDLTNTSKEHASKPPKTPVQKKQKNQEKVSYTGTLEMVARNEEDMLTNIEVKEGSFNLQGTDDLDVTLPPFGPKSSSDARDKVRKTLRLFQTLCRKLLQGEEAKMDDLKLPKRRVDLGAKAIMDKKGQVPDVGKKTHGPVPGVEVGDEFQYRVELALVGIHRPFQGGIDFVKMGKEFFAVSVVASGGYDNEVDKPDCLMYSGAGGVGKDKSYENQKLERGNLALKNNIDLRYPVRVIRGYKVVKIGETSDSKPKNSTTYVYDGLYTVESYQSVTGPHGNLEFRFELKRVPGQPQLAIREVKSKKYRIREGVCVKDISNGKEAFPVCAINTIDDEKPPEFNYITKIMYPEWYKPVPPKGCDCVGRCSDKKCACAYKNGGEIPYNRNGAIVEAKQLVYECGPSCRCSRTCYNRVTQHGMKIHLEIFKTESRGWGVRSLSSISSGSFICEYIGELLEDTEAEKRTGNDEYLFDIGQNYSDCSINFDAKPVEVVKSGDGFTIDALNFGNIGRFINHSCSPNLYAQNVLYDQDDKRMPHIMLFAAENIPPLKELTYHYNYAVDEIHDADGNIKVKNCYCGSSECTGRLY